LERLGEQRFAATDAVAEHEVVLGRNLVDEDDGELVLEGNVCEKRPDGRATGCDSRRSAS
jgi:hypothetical protein